MTVYVEYVLIDNFFIDFMLLNLTLKTVRLPVNKLKIALCSLLGSVFALIYPILNFNDVINGVIKLLFGFLLISLAVRKVSGKKLYVCYVFFLLFTFVLGGTIIGVYQIFNLDYSTEISVAIAFLPCYLIIRFINTVIEYLYQKKNTTNFCCDVEIFSNGKSLKLSGFLDSGNGAYFKGRPIVFLSKNKAFEFFKDVKYYQAIQKVKIQTVNGEKDKLCFIAEEIRIYLADKTNIFNNVAVCLIKNIGDYDVILHNSMIGGNNESDNYSFKAS